MGARTGTDDEFYLPTLSDYMAWLLTWCVVVVDSVCR